ncbi:MAG: hypothetical protein DMF24_02440 [Verrucomicrobia bacterium]|nr:MAG: hypothetical protein DME90_00850 [Verrucomicrobiota bacterium]PYL62870.1 MAG: hypothetical protein DMF24_02440 [Verrucomicrobiota bacterium]
MAQLSQNKSSQGRVCSRKLRKTVNGVIAACVIRSQIFSIEGNNGDPCASHQRRTTKNDSN